MKHIIVTTPKSEMSSAEQEAKECLRNGSGFYFRKLNKKPKDILIGESRIYYVEDGYIRGSCIIIGIKDGSETCETTGREWGEGDSVIIYMPAHTWNWIKPIPMKGFQGWRYFDDSSVKVIGKWTDPKPSI